MTLEQLWDWATALHVSARTDPPARIHAETGDRDDWGQARESIRGLPFTRSFERHIDGGMSPAVQGALRGLRPDRSDPTVPHERRQAQRTMFSVCKAVVQDGATDREACRQRLGLSEFAFKVSATNGLLAFKSALERSA